MLAYQLRYERMIRAEEIRKEQDLKSLPFNNRKQERKFLQNRRRESGKGGPGMYFTRSPSSSRGNIVRKAAIRQEARQFNSFIERKKKGSLSHATW